MKRKLLSFVMLLAASLGLWAAAPADGTYFLYNVENDAFLVRNGSWGSMAVLDTYGQPVKVANDASGLLMKMTDYNSDVYLFSDGNIYCDGNNERATRIWTAESAGGDAYYLKNSVGYVTINKDNSVYYPLPTDGATTANAAKWKFVNGSEYEAIVAAKRLKMLNALLTAAGKATVASEAELLTGPYAELDDVTSQLTWPVRGEAWNKQLDNSDKLDQGYQVVEFELTLPTAGMYKLELPAMYRISSNDNTAALQTANADYNNSIIKIGDNAWNVMSQGAGKGATSEFTIGATINVAGTDYKVPNSQDEFETWATKGYYKNVVYVYAPAANTKITVLLQQRNGRMQVGQWFIHNMQCAKAYRLVEPVAPPVEPGDVTTTVWESFDTYTASSVDAGASGSGNMATIDGWTLGGSYGWCASAIMAINSGKFVGGSGFVVPATNSDGTATGNAFGLAAGWNAEPYYTKEVNLAAGKNEITFQVINVGGTNAFDASLIGFIDANDNKTMGTTKSFTNEWTAETVTIYSKEAQTGKISIGYDSQNASSSNNPHIFIDKISITNTPPANTTALEAAMEKAMKDIVLGFEPGEYAPYLNLEVMQNYVKAKNIVAGTDADFTNQEVVNNLTDALNAATWVANTESVDAVYNGDFRACVNDGEIPGWRSSNKKMGNLEGRTMTARAFVLNSGETNYDNLATFNQGDGTRGAAFLRFDGTNSDKGSIYVYGGGTNTARWDNVEDAICMPLRADLSYNFEADFGAWGGTMGNVRFYVDDEDGTELGTFTATPTANVADGGAAMHVSFPFQPKKDGNCYIHIQNPGASVKHNIIVSNVSINRKPKEAQTITWSQNVNGYQIGDVVELTAEATSGEAVAYTAAPAENVTIATDAEGKTTATFLKAGSVVITANQGGNLYYKAAEPVSLTFAVDRKANVITWTDLYLHAKVGSKYEFNATATSGLPVEYKVVYGQELAVINGNTMVVTGVGTIKVLATQDGDETWAAAQPVKKEFFAAEGELEAPALADGAYMFYNEENDAFLIRNGNWGTMATTDNNMGHVVYVANNALGYCNLTWMDSQGLLFEDGSGKYFCDYNNQGGDRQYFVIEPVAVAETPAATETEEGETEEGETEATEGFYIKCYGTDNYMGLATDEASKVLYPAAVAEVKDAAVWRAITAEEAKAIVAASRVDQLNAVIEAAGFDKEFESEEAFAEEANLNDLTAKATLPASRGEAYQPMGWDDRKQDKIDHTVQVLDINITVPEKGMYVIEFPAMYRNGWNSVVAELYALDYDMSNTMIYTSDFCAPVQGLTAGFSTTNYEYEGKGTDSNDPTVSFQGEDGTIYWAPNTQDSFQAWATNGNYMNKIYTYAAADGASISIKAHVRAGVTGQGQWFVHNAPLTKVYKVDFTESGIEGVNADDAEAIYYNVQGMRIAAPQPGQIYIQVKGTKVTKGIAQ